MSNKLFTIGIEEEFMIIDPVSRELVSHMHEVVEGGKTILNAGEGRNAQSRCGSGDEYLS